MASVALTIGPRSNVVLNFSSTHPGALHLAQILGAGSSRGAQGFDETCQILRVHVNEAGTRAVQVRDEKE